MVAPIRDNATPGPWHMKARGGNNIGIEAKLYTGAAQRAMLATVNNCIMAGAANAHLMVSAPDLLAALEEVLDSIAETDRENGAFIVVGEDTLRNARAAIAKARGEGGTMTTTTHTRGPMEAFLVQEHLLSDDPIAAGTKSPLLRKAIEQDVIQQDLLAVLEEVWTAYESHYRRIAGVENGDDGWVDVRLSYDTLRAMRAAIAKAKGEVWPP